MPSVAKISTPRLEQVARERRDARPGSRLTAGLAPGLPPIPRASGGASAAACRRPGGRCGTGAVARPSIASAMAYSGRRRRGHRPPSDDPPPTEVRVTLPPWDYLFLSFNSDNFPDLFHPTWIASLVLLVVLVVLYNVRTRALHKPPAVPRHVGVAVVDRADHVQPADRSRRCSSSTSSSCWLTEVIGLGDAGLDPVRPLPADPARLRAAARPASATSRKQKFADPEATIRRRGGRRQHRRRR